MNPLAKTFSIYRSSAGSGKTRTLAREYLRLALRFKADYFRYILAVTFTNKASQEMKDRILEYLDDFARGRPNELAEELRKELGYDEQTFRQHSQAVQSGILHQYAQFSISTIDAFFQKVIRSFTREAGLVGDYRLEVEHDAILEQVIDNLIDELGTNREVTDWVVEFARENLENERAWDVRFSLIDFAKEIFREEFKAIEDEVLSRTRRPGFFKDLMRDLRSAKYSYIRTVRERAAEALKIIHENHLTAADFKYSGGPYNFFVKASKIVSVKDYDQDAIGKRPHAEYQQISNWPDRNTPHANLILRIAESQLLPLMNAILSCWKSHFEASLSAEVVLSNFYSFGLLTDIARKLKEFKDENNIMLLADAPKFLNGVIRDSDTPFIYEKVGSFYRNYLIDEFQDTSAMQWKNFQPLITNSLDQGYPAMVVGDVKQAIYRWRGGDLNLLQQKIAADIGEHRTEIRELDRNFRSGYRITGFNNVFFKQAAAAIALQTGESLAVQAYTDVAQKDSGAGEGFVQVTFVREPEADIAAADDPDGSRHWHDAALDQVASTLETLQQRGAELKDIAILVRKNEEGQRIAAHLLQYRNSDKARPGCHYEVVSNESLRIDGASTVNLLLGAMRYLLNPDDAIARAQLGYEFARLHEPLRDLPLVFSVANQTIFENNLPEAFTSRKSALKKLPLIELTETLIDIFGLGDQSGELVYLQAFQDLVLEFYSRERNDLAAFLAWWADNRHRKSVQISGAVNAVQILTIHKSKGLQFKYVIIPFCSWNLDHDPWQAPNLWVRSERGIFADAGYIPVRYSKTLEQTCFSAYYREEHTRTYVDNLNLLYVAFTRAGQGLIVTAPHPDVRQAKNTVAALMYDCIRTAGALKDGWNEKDQTWRAGEWNPSKSKDGSYPDALSLSRYLSSPWREKLVIRQSGRNYFDGADTAQRERINHGIHMHAVLSRMKYADEVESTLDQITFEGLITDTEKHALRTRISELMNVPPVGSWFSRDWQVATEIPVIVPGGKESRLDRLIRRDRTAVVIDFKTGAKKSNDHEQVLAYIDILKQMNFTDVAGYLLYLGDKEVVEVKPGGKRKVVQKRKDIDQLSLGF